MEMEDDRAPAFFDWITTDDRGVMNGIREDAPEDMKKAYEEYMIQEAELKKIGYKI